MSEPVTKAETERVEEIPEGIRRARAALRRDLPALLPSWWTRGKWAAYTGDGRIGVSRDFLKLLRECNRRGLAATEYVIERITPGAGTEEEEEIESRR